MYQKIEMESNPFYSIPCVCVCACMYARIDLSVRIRAKISQLNVTMFNQTSQGQVVKNHIHIQYIVQHQPPSSEKLNKIKNYQDSRFPFNHFTMIHNLTGKFKIYTSEINQTK